ncbi:hypothetical protein SCA6_013909, partial [Theobroma cacao]
GISFSMSMNMEVFDAKEQAEASGHKPAKKGGRKPMLSEHQKRENKIKNCKNYRLRKADEYNRSEAENKSLKEEMKAKARVNKSETALSDQSKIVHELKIKNEALNITIEQMQHDFLDSDVQDDFVNLELNNIPMDLEWLNDLENLEALNETTDSLLNEGTSIAKIKLSPLRETATVEGFRVLRKNSPMIQEIFNNYPNIASGLRFRHQASGNCLMNILAQVYQMATIDVEKCNLEEIEQMEDAIKDLELAGLNISWLKNLVAECREEVEEKEKIKNMEAEVKNLKERQAKRTEERELSKRRRVM